ncbi:beta-1,4 N-acetylgalactosaminyltransferase 1-like [Glandiceps talaboti]
MYKDCNCDCKPNASYDTHELVGNVFVVPTTEDITHDNLGPAPMEKRDATTVDFLDILRTAASTTSFDGEGDIDNIRDKLEMYSLKCICPEPPKWLRRSDINYRRLEMAKEWERDLDRKRQPFVKCQAMSPISYLGNGITVEPFESVPLIGISIHDFVLNAVKHDDAYMLIKFHSVHHLGILYLPDEAIQRWSTLIQLDGDQTTTLTITVAGKDLGIMNDIVDKIVYKSTSYHIDKYDRVEILFLDFIHYVNVHIRRQPLPDLIDPGLDDVDVISNKVTVITKTFERYDCLDRFVTNVRKFYPTIPIIIADDSEFPDIVNASNVKHFTMPFRDGCFAGRNLALSQVRTKYVVFADDDFVFTNETNLESMVEKLEDPLVELDIISGHVEKLTSLDYIFKLANDVNGQGVCSMGVYGIIDKERRRVPGYPQCIFAEMANNFFMAKTTVLRRIGFEPGFIYAGHEEFWMDAVGKAKTAVCYDVNIDHNRTETVKYGWYRYQTETRRKRDPHLLFENNLCYWRNWEFETQPKILHVK